SSTRARWSWSASWYPMSSASSTDMSTMAEEPPERANAVVDEPQVALTLTVHELLHGIDDGGPPGLEVLAELVVPEGLQAVLDPLEVVDRCAQGLVEVGERRAEPLELAV